MIPMPPQELRNIIRRGPGVFDQWTEDRLFNEAVALLEKGHPMTELTFRSTGGMYHIELLNPPKEDPKPIVAGPKPMGADLTELRAALPNLPDASLQELRSMAGDDPEAMAMFNAEIARRAESSPIKRGPGRPPKNRVAVVPSTGQSSAESDNRSPAGSNQLPASAVPATAP